MTGDDLVVAALLLRVDLIAADRERRPARPHRPAPQRHRRRLHPVGFDAHATNEPNHLSPSVCIDSGSLASQRLGSCSCSGHMILSTVLVAISAQERPQVLRILRVLMGHATARAGCVGLSVSQDLTNPEALTISERWATRDDLDEHVRSAEYRLLLAVIDLSVIPPEISFDELEHLGGLDLVQALRTPEHTIRKDDRT